MLPDEKIMCHRTGFQLSCFNGVTKHKCRLWRGFEGEEPQSKKPLGLVWDCADSMMLTLALQNGSLQTQTIASVDKVANEVKTHRDEAVTVGAMLVQRTSEAVRTALVGPDHEPALLTHAD